MNQTQDRRKPKNLLINVGPQLRLFIPFAALLIIVAVMAVLAQRELSLLQLQLSDMPALQGVPLQEEFRHTELKMASILIAGLGLAGLMSLVFWIFISHRVFGPMVPFRRQILSLRNGDYASRIRLRKGDEFKDIAEEINLLSEHLQNTVKKNHEA